MSTIQTHLSGLVHGSITPELGAESGLSEERWKSLHNESGVVEDENEVYRLVYFGGVDQNIRKEVWPYLLGHHLFGSSPADRDKLNEDTRHYYETTMSEWLAVEAIVKQRDKEKTAHAVAKLSSGGNGSHSGDKVNGKDAVLDFGSELENEVFEDNGFSDLSDPEMDDENSISATKEEPKPVEKEEEKEAILSPKVDGFEDVSNQENADKITEPPGSIVSSPSTSSYETVANDFVEYIEQEINEAPTAVIVTDASVDISNIPGLPDDEEQSTITSLVTVEEEPCKSLEPLLQDPKSTCASPASSNGGIYSVSRHFFYSRM